MLLVTRWVSLMLLLMLAGLQVKLWVSGGMRDVWRIELAVRHQESENSKQQARNEQLAAEVSDLKVGAEAVEERARSELGMVKNDEVFYQVIDTNSSGLAETNRATDADFAQHSTEAGESGESGNLIDFPPSNGAYAKQLAQAAH